MLVTCCAGDRATRHALVDAATRREINDMREMTITCVLALGALLASPLFAEEVRTTEKTITTTTMTTNSGTVSQFGPDAIVIKTTSSAPIAYSYTTATTCVDDTGRPCAMKELKPGMPVTVHYTKAGHQMVASKIVVESRGDSDDDD
jgi:hypothetical protein